MPELVLSEYVEPELEAIWEYIAMDNIEAADRFVESAYGVFQELARMPGMGRLRHFPQAALDELRSFRIKGFESYLVFYRPISDGIEVFHILHGARDLESFWEGRWTATKMDGSKRTSKSLEHFHENCSRATAGPLGSAGVSPAVFGVSPNTSSVKHRLHYFLNGSRQTLQSFC